MKHAFGLGTLQPSSPGTGQRRSPSELDSNWYWGPESKRGHNRESVRRRSTTCARASARPRGLKLTPATFRPGPVQLSVWWRGEQPGGHLHVRVRALVRPALQRVLPGGALDYTVSFVEPGRSGKGPRSSSTTAPASSCTSMARSATTPVSGRRASRNCSIQFAISQFDSLHPVGIAPEPTRARAADHRLNSSPIQSNVSMREAGGLASRPTAYRATYDCDHLIRGRRGRAPQRCPLASGLENVGIRHDPAQHDRVSQNEPCARAGSNLRKRDARHCGSTPGVGVRRPRPGRSCRPSGAARGR